MVKNLIFVVVFFLGLTSVGSQTIVWSKLFDIHSINSLGGLSQNSILTIDYEIIVPVVESDVLKLYKFDEQGNIISFIDTNRECGYFSKIVKVDENNFALVYNNTPSEINSTYKLIQFDNSLNVIQDEVLNFSNNDQIHLNSFFIKNNIFYFSIIRNNFQGLYYLNEENDIVLKHVSALIGFNYDNFLFLQSGNFIVDYQSGNNHLVKCISSESGELIWDRNFISNDINTLQLDYKTSFDLNEDIGFVGLERTWIAGEQTDLLKFRKIEKNFGNLITTNSLIPLSNCIITIDDFKYNYEDNHFYMSYRTCFPNQNVVLAKLDSNFNLVDQVSFVYENDSLESQKGSSISIRENGDLIFIYTRFKSTDENGNIYIVNLDSNLIVNGTVDMNIEPKDSSEAFTDIQFYGDSQLLITGLVPNTEPLIHLEEVQHYVAMIDIDDLLSNQNINGNNLITIMPNPTSDFLNIITSNRVLEIRIWDVLEKNIISTIGTDKTIDVSSLSQGVYIVKVLLENGKIFSSKFIKYN